MAHISAGVPHVSRFSRRWFERRKNQLRCVGNQRQPLERPTCHSAYSSETRFSNPARSGAPPVSMVQTSDDWWERAGRDPGHPYSQMTRTGTATRVEPPASGVPRPGRIPFCCGDSADGVGSPSAIPLCCGDSADGVGILRLRVKSALRTSHSAQDDRRCWLVGLDGVGLRASCHSRLERHPRA